MSSERGNTSRKRGQKYQNRMGFKNSLHDTSRKTQMLNNMEVTEVCKRCQDVIAWKIKYKKYKPLSQPKTCTKCNMKTIKSAYHILCLVCAKKLDVCCKCGKKEEIVVHTGPTLQEQAQTMAELEVQVKQMPERRRRTYYRYLEKLNGTKKKKSKSQAKQNEKDDGEESGEENLDQEEKDVPKFSPEEYFRLAKDKLEELKKGLKNDEDDFLDDFDDLELSDDLDDDESEDDDED
ncbi:uncharacterized protein LOC143034493 [Oratosquilla oratoria]|uniref:uncharacterized protein LOC143034493 n=1 Tax=Oratosquilla oratoria TaxID=337810 RepID=UPI003F768C69